MKKIVSILLGICLMALAVPANIAKAEDASPKLIIESYEVGSDYELGGETTVKLVLKNMSDTYTMTDIILSYSSDNSVVPALGTSNQVFIEEIEAGKTAEVTLNIAVIGSSSGYAKMSFSTTYSYGANVTTTDKNDKKVTTYQNFGSYSNSSSYIMFPIVTNTTFTVNSVNVASSTNVGAKAIVGLRYSNVGKEDIKNVQMVITYDDKTETVDIGTIKAGATSYLEHYVTFGSVGTKSISIRVQYETTTGKTENLLVGSYTVEVKSGSIAPTPTPVASTGDNNTSLLSDPTFSIIIVVIGVIVISGIFGMISVSRRKK